MRQSVRAADVLPGVPAEVFPVALLVVGSALVAVLRQVALDAQVEAGAVGSGERRYLIRWSAPTTRRYESPNGGSGLMRPGPDNAEIFSSLQQCLALGCVAAAALPGAMCLELTRRAPVPSKHFERSHKGITYSVYLIKEDSVRLVSTFPKAVNAPGVIVRKTTEKERGVRDPMSEDSLGDAWRDYFESYAGPLDDEWNEFRRALSVVGGQKLKFVREGEDEDEDDEDEDGPGGPLTAA